MRASYTSRFLPAPDRITRNGESIGLPLAKTSAISGDAGAGPSAPGFLATEAGVVVTRRGSISFSVADLSSELWTTPVDGWSNDIAVSGEALYCGVLEGQVHEFSLHDGARRRSFPYEGGCVAALGNDACILVRSRYVEAADWSGRRLWSNEISPGGLKAHADGRLYASAYDPFRRALLSIAESTGEIVWKRELPAEGRGDRALLSSTVSLVAVVGKRVLVIPQDGGRLFVLSSENGEIQSVTPLPKLPPVAQHFVTETEVISFHPFAVSFFDHRSMKETRRIDLRGDVEPLYEGRAPFSHGACLTEDGVIWTTPHGAFMGVTLDPAADGRRTTWVHEIPRALMPRDIPPVVHKGHMYYTNMGDPLELMCFTPASRSS